MWCIKTDSEIYKTFKIDNVFDFITNSDSETFEFSYEYLPLTKGEFLKKFLNVSGDYDNYIELEKKLTSKEAKEKYNYGTQKT